MKFKWFASIMLLLSAGVAFSAPAVQSYHRDEDSINEMPNGNLLDFLLGQWKYQTGNGALGGTMSITTYSNGYEVRDQWVSAGGHKATAYFSYDVKLKRWNYKWVDANGWMVKGHVSQIRDGIVISGTSKMSDGTVLTERQTIIKQSDSKVSQKIEQSVDNGQSWTEVSNGHLIKMEPNKLRD